MAKFITLNVVSSFVPNAPAQAYRFNVDHIISYRSMGTEARVGMQVRGGERVTDYTIAATVEEVDALVG